MQLHHLSHDHKQVRTTLTRKDDEHKQEIARLDQKFLDELKRAETLELTIKQVELPSLLSLDLVCSPLIRVSSLTISRLNVRHMKQEYKRQCIETNSRH
jgi:hypothetical protein